jgi:thymidylate synthase (FAD)
MRVKLVSYSTPSSELSQEGLDDIQDLIAFCARVSNPANQMNTETSERLLKYLMKNKHWSPFEMTSVCLEIETTRDIARQILRHRSFSFQEFCLSGDTDIYFAIPCKFRDGKIKPKKTYKLKELYEKWTNGAKAITRRNGNEIRIPMRERIEKMMIKCYDEDEKKLSTTTIKDIFFTGKKQIYRLVLSDGKEIKTTKEHKFLTEDGFKPLEEITGLELIKKNNSIVAVMTKKNKIAVNGILNYQDKNWLEEKKIESLFPGGGLKYLEEEYDINYNTLRKWLKKHNLQYTREENTIIIGDVWNKGKFGYKNKPHSEETRLKMRESAKKGQDSNLWRGGGSQNDIRKTFDTVRALTYKREKNFKCERCTSSRKLNIHHKIPVSVDPSKINEVDNWELLCLNCHIEHHKKEDYTGWQAMSVKNKINNSYIPKWVDIKTVEFLGEEDTYDIEVNHISHNYVANGIIVHNSQRYANPVEELAFELREARLQDLKNRQNSISNEDETLQQEWNKKQQEVVDKAKEAYSWAIEKGIAKEQARAVLPEGNTLSRLYVNGTIRSWIHYCELRGSNGTQKEHMDIAHACAEVIGKLFPLIKL